MGCPTGKEDGFPPSSFTIFFEYHPQVEPTEEVPEGKAAKVFSIEVKEPKPVRENNTFPILPKFQLQVQH